MKLKLHQALDSVESLNILAAKNLPAVLSFKMAKVLKKISEELKMFDEIRTKKASELGKISDDGKEYIFSDENRKKFSDEVRELLLSDISIPGEQVKISELGDIQMEPRYLALLDWLIVE